MLQEKVGPNTIWLAQCFWTSQRGPGAGIEVSHFSEERSPWTSWIDLCTGNRYNVLVTTVPFGFGEVMMFALVSLGHVNLWIPHLRSCFGHCSDLRSLRSVHCLLEAIKARIWDRRPCVFLAGAEDRRVQSSGWTTMGKVLTTQTSKRLTILSSAAQLRLSLFLGSGSTFTGLNMILSNAIIHICPGQRCVPHSNSDWWHQKSITCMTYRTKWLNTMACLTSVSGAASQTRFAPAIRALEEQWSNIKWQYACMDSIAIKWKQWNESVDPDHKHPTHSTSDLGTFHARCTIPPK